MLTPLRDFLNEKTIAHFVSWLRIGDGRLCFLSHRQSSFELLYLLQTVPQSTRAPSISSVPSGHFLR